MRLPRFLREAAMAFGLVWALADVAAAGVTVWNIDAGQSAITLEIPDQVYALELSAGPPPVIVNLDIRARNQGNGDEPWTVGKTSALAGTIHTSTNYKTMIEFLGGTHAIDGQTSGDWDPLVGGGEGTAPADFGAKIQVRPTDTPEEPFLDTVIAAIRGVLYDIDSDIVPVAGGAFASTALSVGVTEGSLDFRGVGSLGSLLTPGTEAIPPSSAPNSAGAASIAVVGQTATLTIPINVPITVVVDVVTANAVLTGTIVATTTLPIPGDANMDGQVDIFDVNVISDNWNGPPPVGDVNYDGAIDIFDVNVVSDNWGAGSATAVPEPAALALAAIGAAALVRCRQRVRKSFALENAIREIL